MESSERPRGAEAILSILQVEENTWFNVKEVVKLLEERGWLPESDNPPNAVRTALVRLVAAVDSNVQKGSTNGGTVVYRYHEPEDPGHGYSEEPF